MASKLLDKQHILALCTATILARLAWQRTTLLQGIDAEFVSGLPLSPAPLPQLLNDLHELNVVLGDGTVPIVCWLQNACLLAGPLEARTVFEASLRELGHPVPPRATAIATEIKEAPRRPAIEPTEPEPPGGIQVLGNSSFEGAERLLVNAGPDRRRTRFLDRIEQICELRSPGARVMRHETPHPFAGALELSAPRGYVIHRELLVAIEQTVTEEALTGLTQHVLPQHRQYGHIACKLVHLSPRAIPELALLAQRVDVELITFESYQGLVDFSRYTAWLSHRLEMDQGYPSWLYVEQPAGVNLARHEPKLVPNALASLHEIIDTQERRFALIVGDFGAGKSFLLRELARRLLADRAGLVPVLVEMRSLEKTLSVRTLLAQHFADADVGSVDIDAFLYMLHEGRVVLLFDGFDELAVRATYDQVLQHFGTITAAVTGKAKVIVSSRRQHFRDDHQMTEELARIADQVGGCRWLDLKPFEEVQIRRFLRNRLTDDVQADARYRLIHDVKDLLGLSHNPRMLSFIADLESWRLEAAREEGGVITPAKLYQLLLDRWLELESSNTKVKNKALWDGVRMLARTLWAIPGNEVDLGRMPPDLVPRIEGNRQVLSPEEARSVLGARSLLTRDADGMFSFVHSSVLEWLVASEAVSELATTGDAELLNADAMTRLMASFFVDLAGKTAAEKWARRAFAAEKGGTLEKNALLVAGELRIELVGKQAGRDLRGGDVSAMNLSGANLRGANLEGVVLNDRDLTGADLTGARLAHAHLCRAALSGANLSFADLSFARLNGADVSVSDLTGTNLRGAKLLGVKGLSAKLRNLAEYDGAAVATQANVGEIALPPSECKAVAYHPDGHIVASGHDDGTVRLWDAASGKLLHALSGHTEGVLSVAFSPDGWSLVSGSSDNMVRLWDIASGTQQLALPGHPDGGASVAFSCDGRSLAFGSSDYTVSIWDIASRTQRLTLWGHTGRVSSVAFSPDGRTLASGSADNTVRLWDIVSARERVALLGHTTVVWSVAFSPDGRSLASGSSDNTVRLWGTTSGTQRLVLSGHTNSVTSVAFSPDGRSLVTGSGDGTVRLWDSVSGSQRHALSGHTGAVSSVAFSPDSRSFASGSFDNTVRLWDTASGTQRIALSGHTRGVWSVAFSPNGRSLTSGCSDNKVRLWGAASGTQRRVLSGHTWVVSSFAISSEGQSLALGSYDSTVRLWDTASGKQRLAFCGHAKSVLSIAFSHDSGSLASSSVDTTVQLWDTASGAHRLALLGHTESVMSVAFSPDSRLLATGSVDKTVRLWDSASGTQLLALLGHSNIVMSVAFSPDGRSLASGSYDRTVRIWDATSGTLRLALCGHTHNVLSVAFSPDGRSLASGSFDKTVRIWEVASGTQRLALSGHTHSVTSVAFSPDGRTLASSSDDGTIRLWDLASGHCLAVLLSTAEGWVSFVPEEHPGGPPRGAFKMGGDIAGSFWHRIGLARFEPGELDEFLPEGKKLRLPDDHAFLPPR